MICTNCGAHLMETDKFCPKCGTKAIKDKRCPDCGALLRDGAKFCPKCGRLVGGNGSAHGVSEDTLDIPIDAIERNILSETAAEIKADHRTGSAPRKTSSHSSAASSTSARSSSSAYDQSERTTSRKSATSHASAQSAPVKRRAADDEDELTRRKKSVDSESPRRKKPADSEPPHRKKPAYPEPPRKKKVVYQEDDWEDDDWDEDDWDDDDEGVDVITIMTVIVGCVLLVVVAVLGFHLYRQNVPKDYDKIAEEEQEQQEEEEGQDRNEEQEPEGGQDTSGGDDRETTTLTVTYEKVNVRDKPSTDGTNILKKALEGETYPCYGSVEDGEWYEILLEDGTIGYIYYEYISVE